MKGFIYLLESLNREHKYLGSTSNFEIRLEEHNSGVTPSTKGKGPWQIEATWEFETLEQARRIEYRIKRMKRKLTKESVEQLVSWFRKNDKGG